jgi:hypothetical protein
MITYFITIILISLIDLLLAPIRLLPDATLNPNIGSAFSVVGGYFAVMNSIFPIATLLAVLAAVLIVEGGIFLYKIIYWLIKKIPTIS